MDFLRLKRRASVYDYFEPQAEEKRKAKKEIGYRRFWGKSSNFSEIRKFGNWEENPADIKKGADSRALAVWIQNRKMDLFPSGKHYDEEEQKAEKYLNDAVGYMEDIQEAWSVCGKLRGDYGYFEMLSRITKNIAQLLQKNGENESTRKLLNENVERYNFLHKQIETLTGNGQLEAAAAVLERVAKRADTIEIKKIPGLVWVLKKLKKWMMEMVRELRIADRIAFGIRLSQTGEKFSAIQEPKYHKTQVLESMPATDDKKIEEKQ